VWPNSDFTAVKKNTPAFSNYRVKKAGEFTRITKTLNISPADPRTTYERGYILTGKNFKTEKTLITQSLFREFNRLRL